MTESAGIHPMTDEELRDLVIRTLRHIAPETDPAAIPGDADLREAIDLDSMDVLNFFIALHEKLNVDLAESEYGRMRTIDACIQYLRERVPRK